mmetsp:Transcript_59183/g.132673  ORF Transcript_59183/g.132673 Transcript_59183/m.132673 type:complete len:567 (+) Transcript_59183:101-1801(+)
MLQRTDTTSSLPTRRLVRINVRTLACSKVVLHLDEDETVDQLQAHLEDRLGIPVAQQIVCERANLDRKLQRGRFICEYHLGLDDEVIVMKALPPVPPIKPPDFTEEVKALRQKLQKLSGGDKSQLQQARALRAQTSQGTSKGSSARSGSRDRPGPQQTPVSTHGTSQSAPVSRAAGSGTRRIRRGDLECVGRLGVGAFGVVTLEEDRRTGKTYALKAVSKGYLVQLRMVHSVLNEKRILKLVESPFIVRLFTTYNGREHVYFLLEAALGGELFTTYERLRLYGSERHARFYVGCVVEALVHLHDRGVIYRDLKPENLLLDNRGYCKLTDMGLAKVTKGPTYTLVGTPDYMAPEVINGTGHNQAVDWWMLGVLLFEFMVGRPPFEADSADQVYELVRKGIERVHFPPECRHPAPELVRALCRTNPEARLCTPRLRRDPWFAGFDWAALKEQRMQPPRVPTVRSQRDLSNFRTCDNQGDPPLVPYQDTGTNWDADFEDDLIAEARGGSLQAPEASTNGAPRSGTQAVPQPPPWAFTQAMAKAPGGAQMDCGMHLISATESRSPAPGGA